MNQRVKRGGVFVLIALIGFLLQFSNALYYPDRMVMDAVYQTVGSANPEIKIIMIDEETLARYGEFTSWSRTKVADVIERLNSLERRPAAISVDITYFGESDIEKDSKLVEACRGSGNVIMASSILYRMDGKNIVKNGEFVSHDAYYVDGFVYPYDELRNQVHVGFANTFQDKDGYVRMAKASEEFEGAHMNSLAIETLNVYAENTGNQYVLPKTDGEETFLFKYTRKYGGYDHIPLYRVLEEESIAESFADCIVMIGAYASGMQDAYDVPIDRGTPMNGVEIHANIIQSIMDQTTALKANNAIHAIIVAFYVVLFAVLVRNRKIPIGILISVLFIGSYLVVGKMLYASGIRIGLLTVPVMVVVIYIYEIAMKYIAERKKRRRVISAFKKYVAPQVVEEISKKGTFELKLGGEKRDIAVLFVDIRGFTPMSESLEPEKVVEILNDYLALTTKAIFDNGGTLDKFIGDATMAVFNAPFDLDDYVYRAVCTARDIAAGSEELEKRLFERFGKSVSFGVGVNCGPGVVGNIGCDFRMDYTAIGDTVNTAARLESNAEPGQILISDDVYQCVKDRIEVEEIGEIPLKGKTKGVMVYSVTNVL